jgi:CSLREA domain-containing protein
VPTSIQHRATARALRGLLVAGAVFACFVAPAHAAVIEVTILDDFNTGGCDVASCSLREAITLANSTGGADTVDLDAGMYTLTIAGTDEDANANGDLDVTAAGGGLTIAGAGMDTTTIDDTLGGERVLELTGTTVFGLTGVTIKGGSTTAVHANTVGAGLLLGGGSASTITGSRVTGNDSFSGGGGIHVEGGTLGITDTRIDANVAGSNGGGLRVDGGASVTGSRVEISDNSLDVATQDGGGIFVQGNADATLAEVLIHRNSATHHGGGVHLNTNGEITLRNATITDNIADSDGAGGGKGGGLLGEGTTAVASLSNSILSGNIHKRTSTAGSPENCALSELGTINSVGRNLIDDTADCTAPWQADDITGVAAGLGAFGDGGGTMRSRVPGVGSPALDAGDPAVCAGSSTDQRGFGRSIPAGACDLGAAEAGANADLAITGVATLAVQVGSGPATMTWTITNNGPDLARSAGAVTTLPTGIGSTLPGTGLPCAVLVAPMVGCSATAPLAAGASATLSMGLTPTAAGDVPLTMSAQHLGNDLAPANNTHTLVLTGLPLSPIAGSVAPKVTMREANRTVRVKGGRFRLTLRCPAGVSTSSCRVSTVIHVRVRSRRARFSCSRTTVPAGSANRVTCRLSRGVRRRLRKHGTYRAHAVFQSTSGETRATTRQNFRLRV